MQIVFREKLHQNLPTTWMRCGRWCCIQTHTHTHTFTSRFLGRNIIAAFYIRKPFIRIYDWVVYPPHIKQHRRLSHHSYWSLPPPKARASQPSAVSFLAFSVYISIECQARRRHRKQLNLLIDKSVASHVNFKHTHSHTHITLVFVRMKRVLLDRLGIAEYLLGVRFE